MYIKPTQSYYRGSEQCAARGLFLLLVQPREYSGTAAENTFAIVRKVTLRQLGHFMMGRANICGKWHSVTGSYGNDGLPMTVDALLLSRCRAIYTKPGTKAADGMARVAKRQRCGNGRLTHSAN